MKSISIVTFFLIVFLIPSQILKAVPATPFPVTVTQPDGSILTIRIHGDEYFNYKTTLDGYTLAKDAKGILTYAQIDTNGKITSSNVKANNIEQRTATEKKYVQKLTRNYNFSKISQQSRVSRLSKTKSLISSTPQKSYPLKGSPKSLVILVNFKDTSFVTPDPKTAFTNLLNQKGYAANGGTGSANDYFHDTSMGVFNPQFDVVGPFTLPQNMAFYGGNDESGNDMNPQKMVYDACTVAAANNIDFSQYDTDHNGVVDNVFVYYAGYNEAEGGPANSIWPHRWALFNPSLVLNGVNIYDYACTSELRSNSGSNMCGIGTFCHEFGHVLGLPDYYATDATEHHTLSEWNIMDYGPYLNGGRTPPSYSAFDRFYLNWLVPTELKVAAQYRLDTLTTSNKAFLISQDGNHNLNGSNPSPAEFFTFENRQKKGWDTYLPGHGMLVTHIFFDPVAWSQNTVNNDPYAMGVDIVEADGIALTETKYIDPTLSGDPFPGTSNVTFCLPTLRSAAVLPKPLTNIKETNGIISFKFKGGDITIKPTVGTPATDQTFHSFIANWDQVDSATGYYLTAYKVTAGESTQTVGFDNGLNAPTGWEINVLNTTNINAYSGTAIPALLFSNNGESVLTEKYISPVTKLSFFIRSFSGYNGGFLIQGLNSQNNWEKIDSIPVISTLNEKNKTYTFAESKNYTQFQFTYIKGIGTITFDDVAVTFNKQITYVEKDKWVTTNSDTISNLEPNSNYSYMVKTSDKNTLYNYENITENSNIVSTSTLSYPLKKVLVAVPDKNGNITVFIPSLNTTLYVYNLVGQCIKTITPDKSTTLLITGLPRHQLYILKSNDLVCKIAL
ncbi:MAG: M6 family metalloprotease domain-containing protein [Paludibacter sp.]|nr:M6 family metalloprotease domain-containing protein [Paludibacter sp.]